LEYRNLTTERSGKGDEHKNKIIQIHDPKKMIIPKDFGNLEIDFIGNNIQAPSRRFISSNLSA
jgi:hypothetical protein